MVVAAPEGKCLAPVAKKGNGQFDSFTLRKIRTALARGC